MLASRTVSVEVQKNLPVYNMWIFFYVLLASTVFATPVQARNAEVQQFMQDYWQWRLAQSPEFATKLGVNVYQDKLQQLTEEAFLNDKTHAEALLTRLSTLTGTTMTPDEWTALRVIRVNLIAFTDGYKYRKYTQYNPVTPMDDPIRDWKIIIGKMKLGNATDYNNLISRYRAIAVQIDQMIDLMRIAISEQTTQYATSLTGTDERLSELLNTIANRTSFFHTPFYMIPHSISHGEMESLMTTGFDVIHNVVMPAVVRFRQFLSQEYSASTRPEPGISSLPGGADLYRKCLEWHLDQPLTAQEVHDMGLAEVHRIYNLMEKIKREAGFDGTVHEYLAYLKAQPENYYKTEEDMLNGYREIIANNYQNLGKVLMHVEDGCGIEVVQNMNPQSWARYISAAKDGSEPAKFMINVFHPETRPTFGMTALTLHEAQPGHHTMFCAQLARNNPMQDLLRIEYRKYYAVPFNFPFFTSTNEGWALYAESLGEEMGVYSDRLSLLGRYISELFRAARLVVDTGIHAFGWSKEYAVEYLANYTTRSVQDIDNEVNRYISWPGQACSYKIGELKIQELRMNARAKLGEKFDIRKFNDKLLSLGVLPISMIQEQMNAWITGNTVSTASTLNSSCALIAILAIVHIVNVVFKL